MSGTVGGKIKWLLNTIYLRPPWPSLYRADLPLQSSILHPQSIISLRITAVTLELLYSHQAICRPALASQVCPAPALHAAAASFHAHSAPEHVRGKKTNIGKKRCRIKLFLRPLPSSTLNTRLKRAGQAGLLSCFVGWLVKKKKSQPAWCVAGSRRAAALGLAASGWKKKWC
jgi:hypothetical protein